MKGAIEVLTIIISSALLFFALLWFFVWAVSKLPEAPQCELVTYYAYSVEGLDQDAGSNLEIAKELAGGRQIYVRGRDCKQY